MYEPVKQLAAKRTEKVCRRDHECAAKLNAGGCGVIERLKNPAAFPVACGVFNCPTCPMNPAR